MRKIYEGVTVNCWLCKKPKTETDPPEAHKMCCRCSAKLQGDIRLSPMEKSTPLTHKQWVERGSVPSGCVGGIMNQEKC